MDFRKTLLIVGALLLATIIGALPFLVFGLILMISPNYMNRFFTDERLMMAGIGAIIWLGIGGFVMAKMSDFEV